MPLLPIQHASSMPVATNRHLSPLLDKAGLTETRELNKLGASRAWQDIPGQRAVNGLVRGGYEPSHG